MSWYYVVFRTRAAFPFPVCVVIACRRRRQGASQRTTEYIDSFREERVAMEE